MSVRHATLNTKTGKKIAQHSSGSPIQHLWHPFVSGIFVVKANFLEKQLWKHASTRGVKGPSRYQLNSTNSIYGNFHLLIIVYK